MQPLIVAMLPVTRPASLEATCILHPRSDRLVHHIREPANNTANEIMAAQALGTWR